MEFDPPCSLEREDALERAKNIDTLERTKIYKNPRTG